MDAARDADNSPERSGIAPPSAIGSGPAQAAALFEQSVAIMARLRAPGGCPWDREQSFDSIRKYTLEETYEVFDAIEQRDFSHLAEELGDLLLQVLFYAEMAGEMAASESRFTIADVLEGLNRKLVRRHPHVFGEEAARAAGNRADVDANVAGSAAAVLRNWEEIKTAEKQIVAAAAEAVSASGAAGVAGAGNHPAGRLDGVERALPALAEAAKLGSKAAKSGFDWPGWRDLLPKLAEEIAELEAEAVAAEQAAAGQVLTEQAAAEQFPARQAATVSARKPAVEAELGDLLFTAVNLGRHLGADAEMALRGSNLRFRRRFREMELAAKRPLEELRPDELEALWAEAKRKLAAEGAVEQSFVAGFVTTSVSKEQP